jgi:DNA mismatch endonuclease (patch repair protein)
MSQIKSHNTKPEIALRKALRKSGLNYRLKNKKLPGRPDIVLPKLKVAIFVDGDFWHGYFFNKKVKRITKNKSYWVRKIQYNMKRDKNNTKELRKIGWTVLRFWEHQIIRDSTRVVSKILERVNKIRSFES